MKPIKSVDFYMVVLKVVIKLWKISGAQNSLVKHSSFGTLCIKIVYKIILCTPCYSVSFQTLLD